MVRFSARQSLIREIQQLIAVAAMSRPPIGYDANDQDDPHIFFGLPLDVLLLIYADIVSTRYLGPRDAIAKRASPFEYIMELDAKRFRQETRMDKSSFDQIITLINTHEVFANNARHMQAPVHTQLMVFLAKLGRFGNSTRFTTTHSSKQQKTIGSNSGGVKFDEYLPISGHHFCHHHQLCFWF
jgi:hypothetical protein